TQLEQRLTNIDAEIGNLASYSLRGGVGAIGFRSLLHPESENTEWIQIDFDQKCDMDQVILVHAIWRDNKTGFRADGFPQEFRILAGSQADPDGKVIASFGMKDRLLL